MENVLPQMMVWKKHATKVATETGGGILLLQKVF
jgi:hypothetical protein